ncbi:hypothetical protein SDC9_189541 [bioreactor metagenome]|uniref:Uncharacterized protein n=1 Tax=bioreactor metagenome TaxID=1076179 RepID=A0A645HTU2_9ZZZZ
MVKAEQVRQRAVHLRKLAHHLQGLRPVRALPAQFGGNAQRQQAAGAQHIAFNLGRATALVALHSRRRKLRTHGGHRSTPRRNGAACFGFEMLHAATSF